MKTRNKMQGLKTDEDYYRGVTVVYPTKVTQTRQTFIPQSVIEERQLPEKPKRITLKDYQEEIGGPGVFNYPWNEHFDLENPEWKYDIVPEIMDGKNIIDYVDPEIEKKVMLWEQQQANMEIPDEELFNEEELGEIEELEKVRDRVYEQKMKSQLHNNRKLAKDKFSVSSMKEKLLKKGINSEKTVERFQRREQRKREKQQAR